MKTMGKRYLPEDFMALYGSKMWVTPHERVIAMVDENDESHIELFEVSSSLGGATWAIHHVPAASPLVIAATQHGKHLLYKIRLGKEELNLTPSKSAMGISNVSITDNSVSIVYEGLGGGGVGACISRGLSYGPESVEIIKEAGGSKQSAAALYFPLKEKLIVGIDDTDDKEEGATWSLAHNIGNLAEKEGFGDYLSHTLVQLYPKAPHKTQNCVSTVLTFAVLPEKKDELKKFLVKQFKKHSVSDETGIVFFSGLTIPKNVLDYAKKVKREEVIVDDALSIIDDCKLDAYTFSGKNGLIGAVAALPYYFNPREAVHL